MARHRFTLSLLCLLCPIVSAVPSITAGPGVVSVEAGQSATLTWNVSEAVAEDWTSISFVYPKPGDVRYCTWLTNTSTATYSKNYGPQLATPDVHLGFKTISLRLNNVQPDNAEYNYTCIITVDGQSITNSNAWILVYGKPKTPVILSTPQRAHNITSLTHVCHADSTTVYPPNLPQKARPVMTYRWLRNNTNIRNGGRLTVSGHHNDTLLIKPFLPEDAVATYTCVAREAGSFQNSSEDVNKTTLRKPGTPRPVHGVVGPFYEKNNPEIKLKCELEDEGYPPATIIWTKDRKVLQFTGRTYIIAAGALSVARHDGNWTCQGRNFLGTGPKHDIAVHVKLAPTFNRRLTNVTLKPDEASELNVACSVRGKPAPTVSWLYNGTQSLPAGIQVEREPPRTTDRVTTVISRLTWSNRSTLGQRKRSSGLYTCTGRAEAKESHQRMYVNVQYKPGPAEPRTRQIGPYFERHSLDIRLDCRVAEPGNPPARIEWTKDGANKGTTETRYYTIPRGELSVADHDGLWKCTPFNAIGRSAPGTINVTVFAKPVVKVHVVSRGVRPEDFSNLNVLCTCRGRPEPTLKWLFNGGALPDSIIVMNEPSALADKMTTLISRLTWSKNSTIEERKKAHGVFTCVGSVRGHEIAESVTIGVESKPGAVQAEIRKLGPYYAGSPNEVELICRINEPGYPPAKYRWMKDGKTIATTNSSYYRIPAGQLSVAKHDGNWKCEPFNSVGSGKADSFKLIVYAKPVIDITFSNHVVRAEVKTDLDVLCAVTAKPAPRVSWFYKGSPPPSSINVSALPDENVGKLVRVSRRLKWSARSRLADRRRTGGVYSCEAEVADQVKRKEVHINVRYGPYDVTIKPSHNVSKAENENLSLACDAHCSPACSFKWTKDGRSISVHRELKFLPIRKKDKGTYVCTADNGASKQATVAVVVYGAPSKPVRFRVSAVRTHSITVEWLPGGDGGMAETFTIKWTNMVSGKVSQKSRIRPKGRGRPSRFKISDNIKPLTKYQIEIFAVNKLGKAAGETLTVTTQATATFIKPPKIRLINNDAIIHFLINGSTTRIRTENCVRKTELCSTEDIIVPLHYYKKINGTAIDYHDFLGKVELADNKSLSFDFLFWIYDEDTLVSTEPLRVHYRKLIGLRTLVGAILAFVVMMTIILVFFCWFCLAKAKRDKDAEAEDNDSEELEDDDEDALDMSEEQKITAAMLFEQMFQETPK